MNISIGKGVFLDDQGEIIGEGTLVELLNEFKEKMAEMAEMAAEVEEDPNDEDRFFWREAAAFARSRMAARAQAFARQMEHQKARQAMKRRKLMHVDGSFPD